jgi:F420-non-reducing hydrogenase iron-sulfur subunit
MCSGRVDLEFILRAFANGQDGVMIGGCRLGECNYVTHGNYDALGNTYLCKKLMQHIGLNPQRLQIHFMSGADGGLLAEICDAFSKEVKQLGPIGTAEGIDAQTLKFKLEAATKLIPYIRLVEREKLRLPLKSKEAYEQFFTSAKFEELFNASILGNLAISQIMLLLEDGPLSTGRIAERLGLSPSEVSRHMNLSSRHGFVRYDVNSKCYALA